MLLVAVRHRPLTSFEGISEPRSFGSRFELFLDAIETVSSPVLGASRRSLEWTDFTFNDRILETTTT